jgi:threonylcarbamoyladenosine tRNA methylthiotransferase MtaB
MEGKKVAFYTLGCKLNFSETSTIARSLIEQGYKKVSFNTKADIYIINTCTVTQAADKKSRQIIKKATKINPDAYIAVTGCYAQLKPQEIVNIPGVDAIIGNKGKYELNTLLDHFQKSGKTKIITSDINKNSQFTPSFSLADRTRSFLKIQDGCDYKCSFCTIPMARGKSRNQSIAKTIENARTIASSRIKEIVLTGVNLGDFGKTTGESFFHLIKELDFVKGIERFRLSSLEPNLITDEIVEFVAYSNKFLPHFHIPLQSGSNKILKLMRRKYDRELFCKQVSKIKSLIPSACIGVDVIVGFPGETTEDFESTYYLLDQLDVSYLHVFTYSERQNTHASTLPDKLSPNEKNRRSKILRELSCKKKNQFYCKNKGNIVKVLFEGTESKNKIFGFTENYIRVETDFNKELIGKIRKVRLKKIGEQGNYIFDFL